MEYNYRVTIRISNASPLKRDIYGCDLEKDVCIRIDPVICGNGRNGFLPPHGIVTFLHSSVVNQVYFKLPRGNVFYCHDSGRRASKPNKDRRLSLALRTAIYNAVREFKDESGGQIPNRESRLGRDFSLEGFCVALPRISRRAISNNGRLINNAPVSESGD